MKISNVPGEFGSRALYKQYNYWTLTGCYYLTEDEVKEAMRDFPYKWPVEVMDNGLIYIPDESEL